MKTKAQRKWLSGKNPIEEIQQSGYNNCIHPEPLRALYDDFGKQAMKTQIKILLFAIIASAPLLAGAQNYSIDWYTIDGGGGTSTNGQYSLSGTIGQPDAGTLSGGGFTVQGGFWAGVSEVVVPGSPELTIRLLSDGAVQICWPSSATGFELQEALSVSPAAWLPSALVVAEDGPMKCATVPAPAGERFFRLTK